MQVKSSSKKEEKERERLRIKEEKRLEKEKEKEQKAKQKEEARIQREKLKQEEKVWCLTIVIEKLNPSYIPECSYFSLNFILFKDFTLHIAYKWL